MAEQTVAAWAVSLFGASGFYVEAGAHDGVGDSQTLELERAGWRGICVEPSSAYEGLARRRMCRTDGRCLYSRDGTVMFREMDGNAVELSGIPHHFEDHWDRDTRPHRERGVRCVTLEGLLREHGAPPAVDLLVLDTEGSELAILAAHDFAARPVRALVVEHNAVPARQAALSVLMASWGHEAVRDDGTNLWFLKEE